MIKELCMSGAVHRGIIFVGALKRLEELGILNRGDLKVIAGTSIGSFILVCYAIGYSPDVFMDMILETNFSIFNQVNNEQTSILDSTEFRSWVYRVLEQKINPNTPISKIKQFTGGIDVIIATTCIEDGLVYFRSDVEDSKVSIYDCLIASMNLPLLFPEYIIDDKTYFDGGLLDNFPINILGNGALGLKIKSKTSDSNDNLFNKVTGVMMKYIAKLNGANNLKIQYIIEIHTNDNQYVNFDFTPDDKINLFMNGYDNLDQNPITHMLLHKMKNNKVMESIETSLKPSL